MAMKNRLVKLITISAGACLILGSLAGCKPAEEPEATAAASEAQEESETETEAPQASVATSDTEDPAESDPSDDFVIEPEYIELGSEEQKYVNTYITSSSSISTTSTGIALLPNSSWTLFISI